MRFHRPAIGYFLLAYLLLQIPVVIADDTVHDCAIRHGDQNISNEDCVFGQMLAESTELAIAGSTPSPSDEMNPVDLQPPKGALDIRNISFTTVFWLSCAALIGFVGLSRKNGL